MRFRRFLVALFVLVAVPMLLIGSFIGALPYSVMATRFFFGTTCSAAPSQVFDGLAAHDFEIVNEEDCIPGSDGPVWTVVISRPHWWSSRVTIFQYDVGSSWKPPRLVSAGPNAVRISTDAIATVRLAKQVWDGIEIKYSISGIDHPGPNDPPNTR